MVTELAYQKLPNIHRSPTQQYRTLGFHHFEDGGLSVEVELEPGVYAFGWKFVRVATGQATMLDTLPVIVVDVAG